MCPSLSQGTRKALPRTGLLSLQQSGPDARSGQAIGAWALNPPLTEPSELLGKTVVVSAVLWGLSLVPALGWLTW